jgi:arylsulfatase A-like enzyme
MDVSDVTSSVAPRFQLRDLKLGRALLAVTMLSLLFMAGTAFQSAVTLWSRVEASDVMRAASGAALSGRIAAEMSQFLIAQIGLHLVLAAVAWMMAIASAVIWPMARVKLTRVSIGWFCLLAAAVIVYNAYWYPRTLMGAYYHDHVAVTVGSIPLARLIYLGVIALAVVVVARALWVAGRSLAQVQRGHAMVVGAMAAVAITAVAIAQVRGGDAKADDDPRPHVIVLGIDSLRLEQLQRFGGAGLTPNLDSFLVEADLMRDTTTPAARTFSSWMAILTGRSPTVTGARFNLAARDSVNVNPTMADVVRKAGYRTVYSTDEVRFANIDETYGFDQVITPRIGASDFLIGTYNELPLASVVINTRIGKWLFPFSYANRGVATMFQPETYIERLERDLEFDQPTLFIAHLTAPHWPYYVSDTPFGVSVKQHPDDRPLYRIGLRTGDEMFGDLVALLQRKGALANSLVIVLSDHGEALGLPGDSFLKKAGRGPIEGLLAPVAVKDFGHGQSVLSPSQYQVLLSFRTFGANGLFRSSGREFDVPVTVEDIAPTVLDLLQVAGDPLGASGHSLAPLLRGDARELATHSADRVRFTETDLAVLPAPDGGVDEVGTARQNAMFFEVDPVTARLEIRSLYEPLAIAFKERAAFTSKRLLAALPASPDSHQYLLFDTTTGNGRLLLERPDDAADPEGQRLWDALHAHYGEEMKPAVAVRREDWGRIEEEWGGFLRRQEERKSREPSAQPSAPPHG